MVTIIDNFQHWLDNWNLNSDAMLSTLADKIRIKEPALPLQAIINDVYRLSAGESYSNFKNRLTNFREWPPPFIYNHLQHLEDNIEQLTQLLNSDAKTLFLENEPLTAFDPWFNSLTQLRLSYKNQLKQLKKQTDFYQSSAITLLPLICRLAIIHLTACAEYRYYIANHSDTSEITRKLKDQEASNYQKACFASYSQMLLDSIELAVAERVSLITKTEPEKQIDDPWASSVDQQEWRSWFSKVLVYEPNEDECAHYVAVQQRNFIISATGSYARQMNQLASLCEITEDDWYSEPKAIQWEDNITLHSGSYWPGTHSTKLTGYSDNQWQLIPTETQETKQAWQGTTFILQQADGASWVDDEGKLVREKDQAGIFMFRTMGFEPNTAIYSGMNYLLFNPTSKNYLQMTADSEVLCRPWSEIDHQSPAFASWSVSPIKPTLRDSQQVVRATTERLSQISFFSAMNNIGTVITYIGFFTDILFPSNELTWEEIRAEFADMIHEALAIQELNNLENYIIGITNRLKSYRQNIEFVGDNPSSQELDNLADEVKRINDDLQQNLNAILYPGSADILETLPYFWRVSRYKLTVIREIQCYQDTAFDGQYQIDQFVEQSRPKIVESINTMMSNRMNAISSSPERYNEGFGHYMLRNVDNWTGETYNVPKSDFIQTSNCTAHVNYPGYNNYAQDELRKYRKQRRDQYLSIVRNDTVNLFNVFAENAEISPNTITLEPVGNDSWSLN